MSTYRQTLRVGQKPEIITSLVHGFTWITDAEVNAAIERRFRLYDYLTPNDYANSMMLQSVIDQWKDYVDKLYATTQYEYDPILNFDKHIEGTITDAHHKGTKESVASDVTATNTPRVGQTTEQFTYAMGVEDSDGEPSGRTVVNAPTGTDETRTTGQASANYKTTEDLDGTHFDKDERTFTEYREYGNIGVQTTAEIIAKERNIIVDVLDVYVSKFADCFDISSDILRGWLSGDGPDYDEEVET